MPSQIHHGVEALPLPFPDKRYARLHAISPTAPPPTHSRFAPSLSLAASALDRWRDVSFTSSGQISRQSSGRKSLRVTRSFDSRSIDTQSFSPACLCPYITFLRNAYVVPQRAANSLRSSMEYGLRKFLSFSIEPDYTIR